MKDFTGTWSMMLFILKRDKISLFCWILLLPLLPLMSVSAVAKVYPDLASLQFIVASVNANPLEMSMFGPMLAPTLGAVACWKWLMQSAIFLGIFNLFFVIKHTRSEEATGRYELLSSTAIGRYAMISASLWVAFCANMLIGMSITLYMIGYGLPFTGSLALGISAWLIGILMASLSAISAQLTQEASAAKGIMGILLAVFYLLNIIGNSAAEWVAWLSPISWLYKMRPYAEENWYISLLLIGSSLIITAFSYLLLQKRDIGTGFLQQKEKVHKTSPFLNNAFVLAWKLHRKMIFWWGLSFAIMGAICGAVMDTATLQIGENPQFKAFLSKMGDFNVGDVMFSLMMMIFIQTFAAYTILAIGKLQEEEIENRSDILFSVALGRITWALSHLSVILLGMILIAFTFGASAGFFYGLSNHHISQETGRLLAATFAFLPALWFFAIFAFLIFAISPKHYYLSWFTLIFVVVLDFVRELMPDAKWLANLSPFSHVPKVLLNESDWSNLGILFSISLLLGGIGLWFYRKRDLV